MLLAVVAALLLLFAARTADLGVSKQYSIDEFQYAHAAWLVAQGEVPYRDFFEVHHPLLYVGLSPVFLVAGDDPEAIRFLRLAMLVLVGWTAWSLARLNAGHGRLARWLTPLMLLVMLPWTRWATEIRNDTLAFACFAACLATLAGAGRRRGGASEDARRLGRRALLAGVLLGLAFWASQKVVYYGSILFAAWLADLFLAGPAGRPRLLLRPASFVLGFCAVVVAGLGVLASLGALDDWWRWCFAWALELEREHVQIPWAQHLGAALRDAWWVAALALAGVVATLRRVVASEADHDHLLLLALLAALVAHAAQKTAYAYNLIPFLGLLAVFAARGAAAGWERAVAARAAGRSFAPYAALACGLLGMLPLLRADMALARRAHDHNAWQHHVLAEVAALTEPGDACYDNSGSYVARPHSRFEFYTERTTRRRDAERLVAEVPAAILEAGTVLMLRDRRFETLPDALRRWLRRHFQPHGGDVWLWGQRFGGRGLAGRGRFLAVRDDEYVVEPAERLEQGRLWIDGKPVTDPVLRLTAGEHEVRWEGLPTPFALLWLPADGRRWRPDDEASPGFSVIY